MLTSSTYVQAGACSAGLLAGLVVSSGADAEPAPVRGGHHCAWTPADEAVLDRLEAGTATVTEVSRQLGRTETAVLAHLGCRKRRAGHVPRLSRPWTPEEDERLFAMHADGCTCDEIAAALHRSPGAVTKRIDCGLGGYGVSVEDFGRLPLRRPWTEVEDDILAEKYGQGAPAQLPASLLAHALHRPEASIHRRAAIIGLAPLVPETSTPEAVPTSLEGKPWTKAEDSALRRSWRAGEPVAEVALALRRPASEIRARASRLHLRTPKKAPTAGSRSGAWWTSSEDQTIRDEYATAGPVRLARRFGRTRAEVEARAAVVTHPGAYGRAYQPDDDEDDLKGII